MFEEFLAKKHRCLISKCLKVLPSAYTGFQSSRPTILFFLLLGLDVLDKLEVELTEDERWKITKWIYDQQINLENLSRSDGGFRGSMIHPDSAAISKVFKERDAELCIYECGHLAQTYTALCCLLALRDDLSCVNRHATLTMVGACQKKDGSFCALGSQDSENDMRFVFCAAAICFVLDDFSYIEVERTVEFIRRSVNYDGGIGQAPNCESHGGSTYCAIASLYLMGRLWDYSVLSLKQIERVKMWAIFKQNIGFHGRTNKPDDSCYAFWVGATLTMLNARNLIDETAARQFLMLAQDSTVGGFSKFEDSTPDILHTYFSLSALANLGEPFLQPVFVPLNITQRSYEHLLRLRQL